MSDTLSTEMIRDPSQFAALAEGWDALCQDSAADNVFLTWDWVQAWWEHFGAGKELALAVARAGEQLVGVAPLYRARSGALRWLGSGESVSPDHLSFIIRRGCEEGATEALLQALLALDHPLLDLTDVPEHGTLARWLAGARGVCWAAHEWAVCPYAQLPASWQAYEESLSRNMRYNLRRRTRQLLRDLSAELVTWHAEHEAEAGLEEVARLHRLRWQGRAERFSFSDAGYIAFHRDFARRAARRGWLRLYGLRLEGQVIAAWYGFKRGDVLYYYQSGFDPALDKHSPGMVLKGLVVRQAIEEGARELDLLKGDHEYKRAWATGARRTLRIMIAPRGLRGWAAVAPAWLESRKQRVKSLLARMPRPRRTWGWTRGLHANAPTAR